MKLTLEQINELDDKQLSEREVIILKLNTKMNRTKIAEHIGLSKQRVSKIIEAAMAKVEAQRK